MAGSEQDDVGSVSEEDDEQNGHGKTDKPKAEDGGDSASENQTDESHENPVESSVSARAKKVSKPKPKNKGPAVSQTSSDKQRKKAPVTHPRTLDMAIEAIEKLNDAKGASFQSIRSWILEKYQTVRPDMIRAMLKTALQQGLDQGLFTRPRGQQGVQLLSGRYRLTKKGEKTAFVIDRSHKQAETAKRKAAQISSETPVKKTKKS